MFKKDKVEEQTVNQDIKDVNTSGDSNEEATENNASADNMAEDADNSSDNMAEGEGSTQDAVTLALAEAAGWKDKYIRLQAEFDNYRKRTLKEKMDLVASGGEDVIKSLLGVMDDLHVRPTRKSRGPHGEITWANCF